MVSKKEILSLNGKKLTVEDMQNVIKRIGIKKGDTLCVHSQVFSLGKPILSKEEFFETIVKILQDAVGGEGKLIMPTFTYSFCNGKVYDVRNSPSTVGVLTEYFRKMPGVVRTNHPIFSFSIWGRDKEEYLDIGPDAFSLDSVYGKMIRDNGKIMFLGANLGYTFYYLAEERVNVSHRFFKNFSGELIDADGAHKFINVPYFVRVLDKRSIESEEKVAAFLLNAGCQKQVDFGKGTISVIDCKRSFDEMVNAVRQDETLLLID